MNRKTKIGRNGHEHSDLPEPVILCVPKLDVVGRLGCWHLGQFICLGVAGQRLTSV